DDASGIDAPTFGDVDQILNFDLNGDTFDFSGLDGDAGITDIRTLTGEGDGNDTLVQVQTASGGETWMDVAIVTDVAATEQFVASDVYTLV
ncbi:MAG: hypothetical protein O6909_10465, partial [Alphaproteobacteria bacterium]|nr:hypothetical protein [Alphaproteobacteria bacterium]